MRGFRPATEPEVVLAFLRGEMDSDRFGGDVRRRLAEAGGLHLVRNPDLTSDEENRARERALAATAGSVGDLIVMATPDLSRLVVLGGHARLAVLDVAGLEQRLTVTRTWACPTPSSSGTVSEDRGQPTICSHRPGLR
ncbi:hypothetical protein [Paractinoplanes toevensis]|uniref:Uncharacterized protein n=1 Tax=Paractinoplanes toevensis TaxID=571911 RepID=A0A919T852_9ACTN|nr:hypothetical protein [Actinoplanes toevensis]GIM91164.1 hypothetical protein Ato02nite_029570 [Actinoplanes toevensis]